MKTISVIAVKCIGQGADVRTYGERETDATFREECHSLDAWALGESLRKEGMAVIVRPNYNDPGNKSFREWRSFHGGAFKEVVFHV